MKIRCFPAAVTTTAMLTLWISLTTSGSAQEITTTNLAPSTPPPVVEPVKLSSGAADVLKLSQAKVNEEVTVAFIQNSERRFKLTAAEILYLRKEGVSDRILTVMLSQPGSASSAQPPAPTPATAPEASAPQYINPPSSTAVLETTPVYVATPTYYSFYDPWPYYAYSSPTVSFGLYWGWGWGYGHCSYPYYPYYGSSYYCHNGYYPGYPSYAHCPPYANPVNSNRPQPLSGNTGQPQTLVNGRPVDPFASRGGNRAESRSGTSSAMGSPTSFWNNNGTSPTASRSGSQAGSAPSRPQALGSTSLSGNGINGSGSPARRSESRNANQFSGGNRTANPNSVWSSAPSASQRPTALVANPNVNPNPSLAARSSRSSSAGFTTWNQPSSQPGINYAPRPTMNYQSSAFSPSASYRSAGNFSGASRPSMSPPISSGGNPMSSFRGGGGSSGASAPRMSPGGGSRGGGGRSR